MPVTVRLVPVNVNDTSIVWFSPNVTSPKFAAETATSTLLVVPPPVPPPPGGVVVCVQSTIIWSLSV